MTKPKIIEIRVIAPNEHASTAGELVAVLLDNTPNKIFELIEQSQPYQCRPPKEDSSRVYLKFLVKDKTD